MSQFVFLSNKQILGVARMEHDAGEIEEEELLHFAARCFQCSTRDRRCCFIFRRSAANSSTNSRCASDDSLVVRRELWKANAKLLPLSLLVIFI